MVRSPLTRPRFARSTPDQVRGRLSPHRGLLRKLTKGRADRILWPLSHVQGVFCGFCGCGVIVGSCWAWCGRSPAMSEQDECPPQVEADGEERQLQLVADKFEVAGAAESVAAL